MKIISSHIGKIYRNDESVDELHSVLLYEVVGSFSPMPSTTDYRANEIGLIMTNEGRFHISMSDYLNNTEKPVKGDLVAIFHRATRIQVASLFIESVDIGRRVVTFMLGRTNAPHQHSV